MTMISVNELQNRYVLIILNIIYYIQLFMSKFVKLIKERLEEEGGAEEAIELNLSQLNLPSIDKESKAVLEKANNVEVLVINQNQLTSLQTLPNWKLKSLSATENKLSDSSLSKLSKYPQLVQLILTQNDIKTLEGLTPIFALKSLEILDLSQNPVSLNERYRQYVWEKMPLLKVLDFFDRDGNQIEQQFQDDNDDEDGDDDGEVISDDQQAEDEDDEDDDGEGSEEQQEEDNDKKGKK